MDEHLGGEDGFRTMKNHARFAWWGFPILLLIASGIFSSRLLAERSKVVVGDGNFHGKTLFAEISRTPEFVFGFRNFMADVSWLEAVQIVGSKEMEPGDYDRLAVQLNVVANFDPRFDVPYILGGLILGESPDHTQDALAILSRGRTQFPEDWRLPFYMGFTHYFSLDDAVAGGGAMAEAARLPGSPAYLPGLASRMLSEAREPEAALSLLEPIVRQESDPARRAVLERRIREVTVERDLQAMERAVESYRAKMGTVPRALPDLVRAGILSRIPEEPNGGKYVIDRGGKVSSDLVSQRLSVFRKK